MKKSWTIRVGGALGALTLVTSCFVGGTFAKYVTKGTGTDSARVAKWGVTVTATGDMFSEEYAKDDASYTLGTNTVLSTENVVAPGTSGSLANFNISGTPEVAVKVSYKVTDLAVSGWAITDDAFYCPIIITINGNDYSGLNYATAEAFETAVESAIEAVAGEYAPNTDLATTVSASDLDVSWKWNFEGGTGSEQTDEKDTALGNLTTAPTIALEVSVTVTQID